MLLFFKYWNSFGDIWIVQKLYLPIPSFAKLFTRMIKFFNHDLYNFSNSRDIFIILWNPISEILMAKTAQDDSFEIWTLFSSGGMSQLMKRIKFQTETDTLQNVNVFSLQSDKLLFFNSNNSKQALYVYRVEKCW